MKNRTFYRVESIEDLLDAPPVPVDVNIPEEIREPVELYIDRDLLIAAVRANLEAIHANRDHVIVLDVDVQKEAEQAIVARERLLVWLAAHERQAVYVRLAPCETYEVVATDDTAVEAPEPWKDQED